MPRKNLAAVKSRITANPMSGKKVAQERTFC
jgi:hypothetical protein